jgi:hypothetical protein
MPTLILSSRYTTESKILRSAAQALGWETFRCEGDRIPNGYAHRTAQHAIYCTVPGAFTMARQLDAILLGKATGIDEPCFIKPALGKSFDAAVRTGQELGVAASHLPPELLVHASEVVEWEAEYRCFVRNGEVAALSPYRRGAVTFSSYATPLKGPRRELEAASEFADAVLKAAPCPGAFVMDVGIVKDKGWAVVEPNECWGSGIYGCPPAKVLEVLLAATVPGRSATEEDLKWDYAGHYFRACPHMKDRRN